MIKNSCLIAGLIPVLILTACSEKKPLKGDVVILNEFPGMAEAIINRDFDRLTDFTGHEHPAVQSLAYRAMAKSQPENMEAFVRELLAMDPTEVPGDLWFMLSFQQLDEESMAGIHRAFQGGNIPSSRKCELFYRQGTESALLWLLERPDLFLTDYRCALALSTLMARLGDDFEEIENLIRIAFTDADPDAANGLLYGFYRASAGGSVIDPASNNELFRVWADRELGTSAEMDKYMVRILGVTALQAVFDYYDHHQLKDDIQLSVEMAKIAGRNASGENIFPVVEFLLNHPNPHVQVQLLELMRLSGNPDSGLLDYTESQTAKHTRNDEVFIESLRLLQHHSRPINPYKEKLEFFVHRNPYLLDRALPLFRVMDTETEYRERLISGLDRGEISSMHSMRALHGFWIENRREFHDEMFREQISRELERGNRSVISVIQPVLLDAELIPEPFAEEIEQAFRRALENGVRDNANVLLQIMEDRFPERLNKDEIIEPEPFRIPDWQRLYEMGTRPHWILETEKGTIEVRLDPLSAPFTVSSVDSLTRAGLYDNVAFHRVVRNFVIQGGDYDRRDGFGGPDYRIPTEPSYEFFERGAAGIASSGTDTEGSQFFFMHERAPHLDGNYTRFGEVVRGMDVVDKIQVGDKLIRAKISLR
jgi:cyclophilin family peptidyl-prolyl cis-trans isomerase